MKAKSTIGPCIHGRDAADAVARGLVLLGASGRLETALS
eukprot:CAMPEP_0172747156 /NCGR_PEP_ID=MMETSP1074-20121228/142144_1 /TAXON_ID=2916 /ORGANISM="Ceratium fusus, Strain PA161109" /LENGTH=38 /DNA_ID= /DNA_START= /DNA_END= /DNA_ORIENTATION=